jgi:DTW domain-containing protein YfiP
MGRGRGTLTTRCARCGLRPEDCLCADFVARAVSSRIVVLMHWRERLKSTNTGRLVPLLVRDAEVRYFGQRGGAPFTLDLEPGRRALILDSESALRLDRDVVLADPRPVTLYAVDGTWRQARNALCSGRVPPGVQRVALPEGPPGRYRLRDSGSPARVSTLEAIARALGVLEGPEVQRELESAFERFVDRTLRTRGLPQAPED